MSSQEAYNDAKVYADFNRQSLIGCQAPALEMEQPDGSVVNVFGPESRDGMPQNGIDGEVPDGTGDDGTEKFKILLFYDSDCPKCRLQIRLLNALFKKKNYPVDLYAVYVGDDRQKWTECMSGQFDFSDKVGAADGGTVNGKYSDVSICHLWDPTLESDFQRKYGVTQTPRMFLISPDRTIIGRGLDAVALEIMLDGLFAPKEMVYGSRESEELFDGIFAAYNGKPLTGAVKGIADYVHDKTLATGDTLMFKQLAGDYLYYLSTRTGEGFKEGMHYHIDKNILSQDKVWTTQEDSLKILGFARIMSDLLSRALPGTRISSVKVPGELYTAAVNRNGVCRKLDRLKGDENIIIFYTDGCEVCAAEKAAALKLLSRADDAALLDAERAKYKNMNVFMVNVDALMASDPSLASRLMDSFDLSSLPFIIRTDRSGTVLNRYVSFQ
jgi:thiol-disulfide isomerase/thioredoxin